MDKHAELSWLRGASELPTRKLTLDWKGFLKMSVVQVVLLIIVTLAVTLAISLSVVVKISDDRIHRQYLALKKPTTGHHDTVSENIVFGDDLWRPYSRKYLVCVSTEEYLVTVSTEGKEVTITQKFHQPPSESQVMKLSLAEWELLVAKWIAK